MTPDEVIKTLELAKAEVEWNYPMDYAVAIDEAIEAVDKQIPKEPKEYEDKFYACPNCENILLMKWKKYNTELMDKKNGLPYCLGCGQAIDWEVEE